MNLIISNQAISTHNGLYSLNDLHKVSGNEKRHEPNRFMGVAVKPPTLGGGYKATP